MNTEIFRKSMIFEEFEYHSCSFDDQREEKLCRKKRIYAWFMKKRTKLSVFFEDRIRNVVPCTEDTKIITVMTITDVVKQFIAEF